MSILKPAAAQPSRLFFRVSPELAQRLKNVETLAKARGVEVDIDQPLAKALERLVRDAERALGSAASTDRPVSQEGGSPPI